MWTYTARPNDSVRRAVVPLFAVLLAAGTEHVRALPTDSDQPIEIAADRAEHDDVKRVTIYRGGVIIDQGSLHITGDTVTILFDRYDDVAKMIVVGAPAHFRQSADGGTSNRKAWARQMEYFPGQDLIMLLGAARYERDGSHVQADRLVYDSRRARFKALTDTGSEDEGTAGKTPERVRIEIKPKKKQSQ